MKIVQRRRGEWTQIALLGGGASTPGLDPESGEFFVSVATSIIETLGVAVLEMHNGPESSRWIGSLDTVLIHFEYDDMIGTTIRVQSMEEGKANQVISKLMEVGASL